MVIREESHDCGLNVDIKRLQSPSSTRVNVPTFLFYSSSASWLSWHKLHEAHGHSKATPPDRQNRLLVTGTCPSSYFAQEGFTRPNSQGNARAERSWKISYNNDPLPQLQKARLVRLRSSRRSIFLFFPRLLHVASSKCSAVDVDRLSRGAVKRLLSLARLSPRALAQRF